MNWNEISYVLKLSVGKGLQMTLLIMAVNNDNLSLPKAFPVSMCPMQ